MEGMRQRGKREMPVKIFLSRSGGLWQIISTITLTLPPPPVFLSLLSAKGRESYIPYYRLESTRKFN